MFERIERELADGEPWSAFSINRMEWGGETRDCWEDKSSSQKEPSQPRLRIPRFKFWYYIPWLKKQDRQQDLL
ncbi:hypothetical protein BZZ01_01170 [Nostocales cyanobacterium HT-58-2]|nr:hypothetical protein BZZ01_01170 [Nostocales cyanobacterium HT-58-2]